MAGSAQIVIIWKSKDLHPVTEPIHVIQHPKDTAPNVFALLRCQVGVVHVASMPEIEPGMQPPGRRFDEPKTKRRPAGELAAQFRGPDRARCPIGEPRTAVYRSARWRNKSTFR